MRVCLARKLRATDGIVNGRTGTVMKIDLRDSDEAKVPEHFARVKLEYMPYGVWVLFDDYEIF